MAALLSVGSTMTATIAALLKSVQIAEGHVQIGATDAEVALTVCRLKQGVPTIWHNSSGQQRKLCALFMYDTREYDAQFLRAHARDSVARNVLEKPSAAEMHVACWCSPARVTTLFMPQVPCRRKRCTVLENDIFYCGLVVQTATELVLVWMT